MENLMLKMAQYIVNCYDVEKEALKTDAIVTIVDQIQAEPIYHDGDPVIGQQIKDLSFPATLASDDDTALKIATMQSDIALMKSEQADQGADISDLLSSAGATQNDVNSMKGTLETAHAVLLLQEGFLSLAGSKLSYVKLINLEDIRLYFGADRIEIMNGKESNNIRQFKL